LFHRGNEQLVVIETGLSRDGYARPSSDPLHPTRTPKSVASERCQPPACEKAIRARRGKGFDQIFGTAKLFKIPFDTVIHRYDDGVAGVCIEQLAHTHFFAQ
jgi:hypothetical protein